MIPNTKISHTILEFGRELILALPSDYSKEEFEDTMTIVITVWNAVVMDDWGNSNRFESELMSCMSSAPQAELIAVMQLIKRKKQKFATDPRSIGDYWIREENGVAIFGCDAVLNIKDAPTSNTTH